MNNYQWLLQMDGAERKAWFDAEHVENHDRALDGDIEPQNADSRERLEAEIESYSAFDMMDTITLDMVIGWLDRQAAITAEETSNAWEEYRDATQREIAELTAERDKFKELNEYHALQYELASEDCDRLQAQVDTLKSRHCPHYDANEHTCDVHETRIAELTAERERYRSKFGKCIDYADAIHALMDDEGMA